MANPSEILEQLLSGEQAVVLAGAAGRGWSAMASALGTIVGSEPSLTDVDGRLVMPDEIAGDFADPHLAAPLLLTTDQDQSATAYLVAATPAAAGFFDSTADDEGEQEQQTLVMASAILGQVVGSLDGLLAEAGNGLRLAIGEIEANSMVAALETIEDPGLLLTANLAGEKAVAVTMFLPGTFLDIIATSLASAGEAEDAGAGDVAGATAEPAGLDLPFSLTEEELASAEVFDAPREEPVAAGVAGGGASQEEAFREPTPIASGPMVHRASFAPLPDPAPDAPSYVNMDLLAGLDMDVSVELGRTQMTVAQVLNIGPGYVVMLDRLAGEPVDILVNDRVVARGEVIVVEENFGVKVVSVSRAGADDEDENE